MRTIDDLVLNPADREAIMQAAAVIRAMLPVRRILLFGSKARGDDNLESDIDLLVLTETPVPRAEEWKLSHEILLIEMAGKVSIGTLILPEEEWEHGMMQVHPIRKEVRRDGAPGLTEAEATRALAAFWIGKAHGALESANREMAAGELSGAVNRSYYAVFYAASAFLLLKDYHFVKRAEVKAAFFQHLVHPGEVGVSLGPVYKRLFDDCHSGDFEAFKFFQPAEVGRAVEQATELVGILEALAKVEDGREGPRSAEAVDSWPDRDGRITADGG